MNDPGYGTVKFAGDTLICTNGGTSQAINFTYANLGCIYTGNNGAYGMLATITKNSSETTVSIQYRNLTGTTGTPYSVTIPASGADTDIDNVAVTVTAPKLGSAPSTDATVTGGPFTNTACMVSWSPIDAAFAKDITYTATVVLTAPSGYAFASDATATINGHTAAVAPDGDTLTATYQFAAVGENTGPTYELATSVESGETYLIVAKSGSDYYALTTSSTTISSTSYLLGSAVTVSGDFVEADDVTESMLWDFTTDGNGYDVMNGNNYLTRQSSASAGMYISTTEAAAAYTDFMYVYGASGSQLRLLGGQNGDTYYYLQVSLNGSTYYFNNTTTASSTIYLYKLTESGVPITAAAVTDITEPIAGATPDTTALTSTTGVSVSGVTWSPTAATFGYSTIYTASVTLTPQSGYRFTAETTVMVNENAATTAVKNGDGTLTVTYAFGATGADPSASYQLATSVENGGTYVIAYKSSSSGNYYALTNHVTTANYLDATQVTVSGSNITSTVNDNMLWDFSTAATAGMFDIKCDSTGSALFLLRVSGGGNLVVGDSDTGAGYSDWKYVYGSSGSQLYLSSSGSSKYYLTRSSSNSLFNTVSTSNNAIYLFEYVQTNAAIGSVAITDITAPVAGATPDTTATVSTAGVTASEVTWNPTDSPFGYNTQYTASVTLTAQSGYTLAVDTVVTINGQTAVVVDNGDGTLSASYQFPATADQQIGSVAITDITAPVAGASPDTTATVSTAGVTASAVTWLPSVTTFGCNTAYTASVTLTAGADYAFTSGTAVTVNGNAATSTELNPDGTLTVTYAFPATANQQITSVAVTDIDMPVAGQTPDEAAEIATAGVTLSAVTWSPSVTTFGYNTAYTASVTLTAGADYAFASGTAVTVNGLPATTKTLNPDGTMVVTCTFVATAKQQIGSVAVTGIDTPVAEALADQSAAVETVGVASVSDVTWDPDAAAFGYNIAYTASVTLTPAADYTFTSGTTATINGHAAIVTLNSDGTLTLTYTFPNTENSIGATLGISGPSQLMIGESATYEVFAVLDNVAALQATLVYDTSFFELVSGNVSGELDYDTNQSGTVTLTSVVLRCKASAGTSGTLSLDNITVGRLTGDGTTPAIPVSYEFLPMTVSRLSVINSVVLTDITTPEVGVMPDTTATVSTAGVTASAITWAPMDTPFGYNTAYTASVTLTAGTGIAFAPDVSATVNGHAATSVILNGDGSLTVTYAFTGTNMQTPDITAQPQNVTNIQNATVELSVTATASKGTLSYQWYSNDTDSNTGGTLITGAILNSYTAPTSASGIIYYYCVVTNSDNAGLGSAAAVAASNTAKVTVKLSKIQSSVYTVDTVNGLLTMVSIKTSVAQLKSKLVNDPADIKIFDGANEYTGDAVKTGMTVKYYFNDNVIDQLTISVFGDPSGDGEIDINDILYLRAQIVGTYTMTACELATSDFNGDSVIDILDILYIRAHILGTYTIVAQ